jgi:ubiquinone/menaquinone biosynthesis C-methylase UbiE
MYEAEQHHQQAESRRPGEEGVSYSLFDDSQQSDALDAQHYLVRHALQGNYLAPIAQPERILDIGCGTGRWLAEMAREFPQAELIGMDPSLPAKETATFPSNCRFLASDALDALSFENATFDFTHQRFRLFAVPLPQWQSLIHELARVTRRGGWMELTEINPFLQHMGPNTERVMQLIMQAASARGLDPAIAQRLSTLLGRAGLKRVGTSIQLAPVGNWGGHPGALALAVIRSIAREMQPLVIEQALATPEEFLSLTMHMTQEAEQYHTTLTFHIAYGHCQQITSHLDDCTTVL